MNLHLGFLTALHFREKEITISQSVFSEHTGMPTQFNRALEAVGVV